MRSLILKPVLLRASRSPRLRRAATEWSVARRVARRFVAGESLDEAVDVVRRLTDRGFLVSLDHLGEEVETEAAADTALEAYLDAARRLDAESLPAELSVKPSSIADSEARLRRIVATDREVTLDMEDHTRTDLTLNLFRSVAADASAEMGIALQAYLRRTPEDLASLARVPGKVRLTKGAYAEPEAIAFTGRAEVDAAFDRLTTALFHIAGPTPAIATHDEKRVTWARATAAACRRDASTFEFQMLYGVRRPLQEQLRDLGYRVRIYVPYGQEWYPYLVRRLAERPANLTFFLRAFIGR